MRLAFVGKGGAGKSTIAGTFARLLARRGVPVLAVDSDPMPGLAFAVGVAPTDVGVPDEAVDHVPEGEGGGFRLRPGLTAEEAVERYADRGPDGLRLLQMPKLRGHAREAVRSQWAFRQILDELPAGTWHVVGDLPAGTRQPFFGWSRYARTIVVVAEPTPASLLTARRLARLATAEDAPRLVAVASKVRTPDDAELVEHRSGLPVVAAVPLDEAVALAERQGLPPVDAAPESPLVRAVESLVERLWAEEAST